MDAARGCLLLCAGAGRGAADGAGGLGGGALAMQRAPAAPARAEWEPPPFPLPPGCRAALGERQPARGAQAPEEEAPAFTDSQNVIDLLRRGLSVDTRTVLKGRFIPLEQRLRVKLKIIINNL